MQILPKLMLELTKLRSENSHNYNQLLRNNTIQVLTTAISAVGVIVALVANIIF